MPNTPSAKKDLLRSQLRRRRNRSRKSLMRTWIKKTITAVEAGDKESAEAGLRMACKHIDKNTKWHQIHPNTAIRRKSKLARMVSALKTS